MSNFSFLQATWTELFATAFEAEQNANSAPRTSCFYTRRSLEIAVKWLYANDSCLKKPYSDNLAGFDFSTMTKPFTKISESDTKFI